MARGGEQVREPAPAPSAPSVSFAARARSAHYARNDVTRMPDLRVARC